MIADWEQIRSRSEREMTVCIAAPCFDDKIILCTDWRESSGLGSAETTYKQAFLPKGWACLTAGDTTEINAIVPLLRRAFDNETIDETNIIPTVEGVLRGRLLQKRDILSHTRFNKPYDEIYLTGKEKLPTADFTNFINDIAHIRLDAELIVAGFYNGGNYIVQTDKFGKAFMPNNFAVIGEGSYLAHASLMRRAYIETREFGPALYCIYEAKIAAQAINSVGELTTINILESNGKLMTTNEDKLIGHLNDLYRKYGPRGWTKIDLPDELFK